MKWPLSLLLPLVLGLFFFAGQSAGRQRIIIDTDIGQDIDDSWALALALGNPAVSIELVLTAAHNTRGRAQVVAKYLTAVNRTTIPIGIGVYQDQLVGPLYGWASDFNLSAYPGPLYSDGVAAAAQLILANPGQIVFLAIAPFGNFEAMVRRFPATIPAIKKIYAMGGSFDVCYENRPGPCPEYNVADNVNASKVFFAEQWPLALAPLDTCNSVQISDGLWHTLILANSSANIILNVLLENFCYWTSHGAYVSNCILKSSILFDPTALLMSWSPAYFDMDILKINITNIGETITTTSGKPVDVALSWAVGGLVSLEQAIVHTLVKNKS